MINGMPQHAQTPIKSYLETGKFKDHQKFPMPDDADTREMHSQLKQNFESYIASDDTAADSDKRPGYLTTQDPFFGTVNGRTETSEDGQSSEAFMVLKGAEGNQDAVMYSRSTPAGLDVITVGSVDGADGVMHFSNTDPNGHFMTFAE
jgi:hypothetical protein